MILCRYLRWKAYYGGRWADAESLRAALAGTDAPFSCLKTCQPWGPDDDTATPERCTSERECFRPSPLDPTANVS